MDVSQWSTGLVLLVVGIDTLVGVLIGQAKRRVFAGTALGFLIGPLGWLITALLPAGADSAQAACPFCLGPLPLKQSECAHCNRRVVWVAGKARKPSGAAVPIGH